MKAVITAFARIRESIVGMAGLAIVLFWVLVAVFADIISPFDPLQQISPLATPGTEVEGGVLILGADFLGRDILSRIVHGTRTIMLWAPLATGSALMVGIVLGLVGGFYGGRVDDVISFTANMILAFPVLCVVDFNYRRIGTIGGFHCCRHHFCIITGGVSYRARGGVDDSQP